MLTKNQALHVEWVRDNFPQTYQEAMLMSSDTYNAGLNAMPSFMTPYPYTPVVKPAVPEKSWFTSFTQSIQKIAPALVQYKTQKDILKLQLDRAKKGLPPLDTSALAPTIRVQPELSPEMYSDLKKYVLPVSIGIGALLVAVMMSRKK
jgi:hypothetical protein